MLKEISNIDENLFKENGHSNSFNSVSSQNNKNYYVSSKGENEINLEENKKIIQEKSLEKTKEKDIPKETIINKTSNSTIIKDLKNIDSIQKPNMSSFKFKEKFEKLIESNNLNIKTEKKGVYYYGKINKNLILNLKNNLTDILAKHYEEKNNIKEEEKKIKLHKLNLFSEKLKLIDHNILKKLNKNFTMKFNNITEKHLEGINVTHYNLLRNEKKFNITISKVRVIPAKNITDDKKNKINNLKNVKDDKKTNMVDHLINLHQFRI